jgi:hypothetical protein
MGNDKMETNQPSVEELKKDTINIQYVVCDTPPSEGFKRMSYYTELASRPGLIYLGLSYRTPTKKETLYRFVKQQQIMKLPEPKKLDWSKDVFLNNLGEILLMDAVNPLEDESPDLIARLDLKK